MGDGLLQITLVWTTVGQDTSRPEPTTRKKKRKRDREKKKRENDTGGMNQQEKRKRKKNEDEKNLIFARTRCAQQRALTLPCA